MFRYGLCVPSSGKKSCINICFNVTLSLIIIEITWMAILIRLWSSRSASVVSGWRKCIEGSHPVEFDGFSQEMKVLSTSPWLRGWHARLEIQGSREIVHHGQDLTICMKQFYYELPFLQYLIHSSSYLMLTPLLLNEWVPHRHGEGGWYLS